MKLTQVLLVFGLLVSAVSGQTFRGTIQGGVAVSAEDRQIANLPIDSRDLSKSATLRGHGAVRGICRWA